MVDYNARRQKASTSSSLKHL